MTDKDFYFGPFRISETALIDAMYDSFSNHEEEVPAFIKKFELYFENAEITEILAKYFVEDYMKCIDGDNKEEKEFSDSIRKLLK